MTTRRQVYVYAENCVRAGEVVGFREDVDNPKSDDYFTLTRHEARVWLRLVGQDAAGAFNRKAARNVLAYTA